MLTPVGRWFILVLVKKENLLKELTNLMNQKQKNSNVLSGVCNSFAKGQGIPIPLSMENLYDDAMTQLPLPPPKKSPIPPHVKLAIFF